MVVKLCKIALIGNCSVGKTTLVAALKSEQLLDVNPTIGASFVTMDKKIEKDIIRLEIWDTAGSERFAPFMHMYIRNSKIVLLCFDIPDISIIEKHERAIENVEPGVNIIYVATKVDNEDDKRMFRNIDRDIIFTSSYKMIGTKELYDKVFSIAEQRAEKDKFENEAMRIDYEKEGPSQCCVLY
jgi:small GTP-binding protein